MCYASALPVFLTVFLKNIGLCCMERRKTREKRGDKIKKKKGAKNFFKKIFENGLTLA